MYLSDRDLKWAIDCRKLIVDPRPSAIDSTSIDLHLDAVTEADVGALGEERQIQGEAPYELRIGKFDYRKFSGKYLMDPPDDSQALVFRRGSEVVVKPRGFLLWQTKEVVGTPEEGANLICFIDGKSTRARTGLLVHLTAPTIHASWSGEVTLEIANLGPFHFILKEDDVIAQITVAMVSSIPAQNMKTGGSVTYRQLGVTGAAQRAVAGRAKKAMPSGGTGRGRKRPSR
jgi:dCTP deaminase